MNFGVCANFAFGKEAYNGQTVKARNFTDQLSKEQGDVIRIDTSTWMHNPFSLFFKIIKLFYLCENIIIMPDQRGIYIILPLSVILKGFFKKKLYYVVVGGWLPEFLVKHKRFRNYVKKTDQLFVQADLMKQKLKKLNLNNATVMHNFKDIPIIGQDKLYLKCTKPYKTCVFSRITKDKGIELAIDAVKIINRKSGGTVFTLDIWGEVDSLYKKNFENIMKSAPDYIIYRGVASPKNTCDVLKDYSFLLFPTFFHGEGFAGTILDALAAGLPVVASDWKYNNEFVKPGISGFLCKPNDVNSLVEVLEYISNNYDAVIPEMKINCLKEAEKYRPEKVISGFLEAVNSKPQIV